MRLATDAAVATIAAACCLAGLPAAGGEGDLDRHEIRLRPEQNAVIEPFMLDRVAVHDIASGDRRLSVRATPDGFLRFHAPAAAAEVTVTGTAGNRATFRLQPGDRVAVWPARRLEVRASPSGFAAAVGAADWAFVVRADKTSSDGITVRCGGASCLLMAGWRLAMDRRGDDVVFRVVQKEWPGRIVGKPGKPAPVRKEAGEAEPVKDAAERVPPLPLVERRWAAWEVRPAPPVSP
ncbi:MAG: hypothetical protein ACYTKD_14555 [Planctomycetota bacterium]